MSKVNWKELVQCIPDRVQVSANSFYDILWSQDFNGVPYCGTTTFDPKQITIKMGMSAKLTVLTFLHELDHAISEEFEIGLTETQILKLEKAAYYKMKKNNVFDFSKLRRKNVPNKRTKRVNRKIRRAGKKIRKSSKS